MYPLHLQHSTRNLNGWLDENHHRDRISRSKKSREKKYGQFHEAVPPSILLPSNTVPIVWKFDRRVFSSMSLQVFLQPLVATSVVKFKCFLFSIQSSFSIPITNLQGTSATESTKLWMILSWTLGTASNSFSHCFTNRIDLILCSISAKTNWQHIF